MGKFLHSQRASISAISNHIMSKCKARAIQRAKSLNYKYKALTIYEYVYTIYIYIYIGKYMKWIYIIKLKFGLPVDQSVWERRYEIIV
jgi:hypothetical protein